MTRLRGDLFRHSLRLCHLTLASSLGPTAPLKGKAFGDKGKAFGDEGKAFGDEGKAFGDEGKAWKNVRC